MKSEKYPQIAEITQRKQTEQTVNSKSRKFPKRETDDKAKIATDCVGGRMFVLRSVFTSSSCSTARPRYVSPAGAQRYRQGVA